MSKQTKPEAADEAATPEAAGSEEISEPDDPAVEIERLTLALNHQHEAHLRAVAEAENVRRRAQRDVSEAYGRGQRRIVGELLAAVDSLELGLSSAESATAESLMEGQHATLRQMQKVLETFGVEALESQGEPFDPEHHEAVGLQPSDAVDPDCVISVMQKGYLMQGRLLRAARVVVCSGPPQAPKVETGEKDQMD